MNAKLFPFVNVMQSLSGPVQERHRIAAIAIGYACACNSVLPTSEVDDAETHYRMTVEPFAKRVVSALNEVSVLDTALALDFARGFWLLRYEAVHKCPRMDQVPGDFFCSVFGVPKFFSPEMIEFANKNNQAIGTVYTHICNVIADNFATA
ncbi:hypothetical protein [Ralstonia phage RP31]|uniref:Uncharacterized protein n=2 Tax=Ripduovirus RP12 TaxID=2560700 RepID=A0A1L7N164_9CAUD|nr:hypothetical protein FDH28_gp172 [Ralstonia phage RP12]BAW19223.1 hypothetical protein [Ralstonia phage RP12]BAW19509.1 hypothetical protein [Ralstonia phage RP31]